MQKSVVVWIVQTLVTFQNGSHWVRAAYTILAMDVKLYFQAQLIVVARIPEVVHASSKSAVLSQRILNKNMLSRRFLSSDLNLLPRTGNLFYLAYDVSVL